MATVVNDRDTELQDTLVRVEPIPLEPNVTVGNGNIEDGAVDSAKLADSAVTSTKFANGIEPVGIVTAPTLPTTKSTWVILWQDEVYRWNGTAYEKKISSTDIEGQLTDAQIAAIAAAKLTGQITTTQITDNAITAPKVSAGAIETDKLAANAVVADKIAANAVTADKINANAVTSDKINANAVTAGKVAAGAISTDQLTANAVTADKLAATALDAKHIRGSNVFAGAFGTKGSVLTAAAAAGATTLNLQNTTDFPASGSAVIFSATSASDYDVITYTGKTATTLTGVGNVLAQATGNVIIPLVKTMVIDSKTNEMRFYGDRGDGTVERLAAIGILTDGTDSIIGQFGSPTSKRFAINAETNGGKYAGRFVHYGNYTGGGKGYALQARAEGGGHGLEVTADHLSTVATFYVTGSSSSYGVTISSKGLSTGMNLMGDSAGISMFPGGGLGPGDDGQFGMVSGGNLAIHDGTKWNFLYKDGSYIKAAGGTAAAPGLTFGTDTNTGIYRYAANIIGFTTNGTLAGYVDASGNWNFVKNIGVGAADPSGSATINASATIGGNATRYGINNALVVDGTETLTANRSYYGSRSIARSTIGITPKNGQTVSLYGSYSLATVAETAGGTGNADNVYGAYNYGLVWSATNAVVDSVYGTYSFAQNSVDSLMRVDHLRGMFAWARQSTAENGVAIYGSEAIVQVDDGSFTDGYIYKGSMSVSAPGSVPNKWGFYLTGCAKSYIDGTFETGGTITSGNQIAASGAITAGGALNAGGSILTSSGLIGYATGAGSTITQLTSKSTGVTINASCGLITTFNGQLNAGATVSFTVTNSSVTAADTVILHRRNGGSAGAYEAWVDSVANGSFVVYLRNRSAGPLAEAVNLNFSIINVVNA